MPLGQLLFNLPQQGSTYVAEVGIDAYIITRPISVAGTQTSWITIFLNMGAGTVTQVGTYTFFQDAVTGAQNDFTTRAT